MNPIFHSETAEPGALDAATRSEMFGLFRRYYDNVGYGTFERDLDEKSDVLLIRDGNGAICGFTTLVVKHLQVRDMPVAYLFSGDTVQDEALWANPLLLNEWFRHAGRIKARMEPGRRLFWFLITKGHRTYRVMSTFFRAYVPDGADDSPALLRL